MQVDFNSVIQDVVHISLRTLLGQGGFGKVFLADVSSGQGFQQQMAVKVLHDQYQQDDKLRTRLLDEARMLGMLNHRNVVKVYDVCEFDKQTAILMEYVEGYSISKILKQGPMEWGAVWKIIADVAAALEEAYVARHPSTGHPLRFIHRDIKPSNILLSKSGTIKILDFGIAKMDGVRESKTSTHQMGTARYMAPEQWLENQSSPSVDVFALARTTLEMLHGALLPRVPLDRILYNKEMMDVIQRIPMQGVSPILADVGRDLLWAMLSYDPQQRLDISDVAERALGLSEALGDVSLKNVFNGVVLDDSGISVEVCAERSSMAGLGNSQTTLTLATKQDELGVEPRQGVSLVWGVAVIGLLLFIYVWGGFFQGESHPDSVLSEHPSTEEPLLETTTPQHIGTEAEPVPAPMVLESTVESDLKSLPKVDAVKVQKKETQVVPMYNALISSVPLGATVFVDGEQVGRTLLKQVSLSQGVHQIEFRLGDKVFKKQVSIASDVRFVWNANANGESEWSSFLP